MCKLLLSKGANWKKKDQEGQKALHLATRHQKTKCMALIMKHLEPGEVDEQDKANVSNDRDTYTARFTTWQAPNMWP